VLETSSYPAVAYQSHFSSSLKSEQEFVLHHSLLEIGMAKAAPAVPVIHKRASTGVKHQGLEQTSKFWGTSELVCSDAGYLSRKEWLLHHQARKSTHLKIASKGRFSFRLHKRKLLVSA
jgi:hypothetical protein